MLLRFFRTFIGYVVVFFDLITRGKGSSRSPEEQAKVQAALEGLSLYQHHACPFCTKTRRALYKLSAKVELRDIRKDPKYRQELEVGGGRVKTPCLRIESGDDVQWMYESGEIINYISERVSAVRA